MYQEGEVKTTKCTECGESFPVFTFVSDTDMVTFGCVALTGQDKSIILTEHRSHESLKELEARVGLNYKVVNEQYINSPISKGISFQKYLKEYEPNTVIHTCIYCGSNCRVVKQETKEQFLAYGKIEVLNVS